MTKKRLTAEQERALAVLEAMDRGEYESDDWEYAKGLPGPDKPGHRIAVDYDNEGAHRLFARADKLGMTSVDLVRLYVERGLAADEAAEARSA